MHPADKKTDIIGSVVMEFFWDHSIEIFTSKISKFQNITIKGIPTPEISGRKLLSADRADTWQRARIFQKPKQNLIR